MPNKRSGVLFSLQAENPVVTAKAPKGLQTSLLMNEQLRRVVTTKAPKGLQTTGRGEAPAKAARLIKPQRGDGPSLLRRPFRAYVSLLALAGASPLPVLLSVLRTYFFPLTLSFLSSRKPEIRKSECRTKEAGFFFRYRPKTQ